MSKQTRHLPFDHPSMQLIRDWVTLMIETKEIEPRLMCHFDQVWTTHFEAAKKVLHKKASELGNLQLECSKPSMNHLLQSIREALSLPQQPKKASDPEPGQRPTLCAQSTLVPVEYQRNARTTTTLTFADGSMGRAYVTASSSVL